MSNQIVCADKSLLQDLTRDYRAGLSTQIASDGGASETSDIDDQILFDKFTAAAEAARSEFIHAQDQL